jgi:hypothetical protein
MSQSKKNTSTVGDLISPVNGYRGAMKRRGITPKDHMKDNFLAMKALEKSKRIEKENALQPEKELYKLSQFRDIPSKVLEGVSLPPSSPRHEFLTRDEAKRRADELKEGKRRVREQLEEEMEYLRLESAATTNLEPKPAVPKASTAVKLNHRDRDFVAQNKHMPLPSRHSARGCVNPERSFPLLHDEFGRIPEYLQQRQQEWEEREKER